MATDPNTLMDQARCVDSCISGSAALAVIVELADEYAIAQSATPPEEPEE